MVVGCLGYFLVVDNAFGTLRSGYHKCRHRGGRWRSTWCYSAFWIFLFGVGRGASFCSFSIIFIYNKCISFVIIFHVWLIPGDYSEAEDKLSAFGGDTCY